MLPVEIAIKIIEVCVSQWGTECIENYRSNTELDKLIKQWEEMQEQMNESVGLDAEIDLTGLIEYLEKSGIYRNRKTFLDTDNFRKSERNNQLQEANRAASAYTEASKARVRNIFDSFVKMISKTNLDKMDNNTQISVNYIIDEVRKVLRDELSNTFTEETEFQEVINSVVGHRLQSSNKFHYLYPDRTMYGRTNEMNQIIEFLDKSEDFRIGAICAKGGMGKSKLAYEFMKQGVAGWKIVNLNHVKLSHIARLDNYYYDSNLLIIVDYCNKYTVEIGNLISNMNLTRGIKDYKVRLLLIDRAGLYENIGTGTQNTPFWLQRIEENAGTGFCIDECIEYITFSSLSKEDIYNISADFAKDAYNCTLAKKDKDEIYNILVDKICDGVENIIPLYILIITDLYLSKENMMDWNINNVLNKFLQKAKNNWLEIFRRDEDTTDVFLELLYYATVVGEIDIRETQHKCYEEKRKTICRILGSNENIREEILYNNAILRKVEPDIIGEYFVLSYFSNIMNNAKSQELSSVLWENPQSYIEFLCRALETYGSNKKFTPLFKSRIELFIPKKCCIKYINDYISLLINMMLFMDKSLFHIYYKSFQKLVLESQEFENADVLAIGNKVVAAAHTVGKYEEAEIVFNEMLKANLCASSIETLELRINKARSKSVVKIFDEALYEMEEVYVQNRDLLEKCEYLKCMLISEISYAKLQICSKEDYEKYVKEEFEPVLWSYLEKCEQDTENMDNKTRNSTACCIYLYCIYLRVSKRYSMDEITKKLHEGLKYSQGNLGTTMFIYNEIGLIHSGGNAPDWDQAIAAFRKSLDFREVYYKGDNTFIARGKDNLGRAMALGRQCSDETESLLKEALVTHKKYLGEAHQDVGRNTFNLGLYYLYKAIPDYDEAKKNFLNAKKIYSCLKISESIKLQIKYCDDRLNDVYDGIRNSESNENEFR